jgi:hypothetical protein
MDTSTMQLGELCRRLGVPSRHARYVFEQELAGFESGPGTGHHRQLAPDQAFYLGIVLKLKASGVQAPLAGAIAGLTAGFFQMLDLRKWDPDFAPFKGQLSTKLDWYLEVADREFYRIFAEREKKIVFPGEWLRYDVRIKPKDVQPSVRIQVNLTRIARLLQG